MTFTDPEIAGRWGCLDDAAFADGEALSTHVMRELCRQSNRQLAKGGLLFSVQYPINGTDTEADGACLTRAGRGPSHLLPAPLIAVNKKPGIVKMHVALRLWITTSATIYLQIGTLAQPFNADSPITDWIKLTEDGSGNLNAWEFDPDNDPIPPLRRDAGEVLTFHIKGLLDPDSDTKMVEATYGTKNSGTVTGHATLADFEDSTSAWNTTGNTPSNGGHYVVFKDAGGGSGGGNNILHRATITSVPTSTRLGFSPRLTSIAGFHLNGAQYDIYKLPNVRVASLSCYGAAREVQP